MPKGYFNHPTGENNGNWKGGRKATLERYRKKHKETPEKREIRIRFLAERITGDKHPRWKGGIIHSRDYVSVWISPNDFFYSMAMKSGYVLEHRLIMAKHLGRNLHSWEIVHHKGTKYPAGSIENKQDNRIENLQLVTDAGHKQITYFERILEKQQGEIGELQKQVRFLKWELKQNELGVL